MQQTKIQPIDLNVHGDPDSGEVYIHYRTGPDSATSIQLNPKLLGETLLNLVLCASQSKRREILEVVQLFATRELHAKVAQGPLLVLEQQLECGLSITTTLESAEAEQLAAELTVGVAAVKGHGGGVTH